MVRRGIVLALALNLLALVPLPLAACAIASGLEGQCQCPMTMMQCEGTMKSAMPNSGPQISCRCIEAGAPFPQARERALNPTPSLLATNFVAPVSPNQPDFRANSASSRAIPDPGPPGGQARLCVFLI